MYKQIFTILLIIAVGNGCAQRKCDLRGSWLIKKGTLTPNYRRTGYSYSRDFISLSKDSIYLATGFFYSILPLEADDWALGRYPFVYYGDKERYKISRDSLHVYCTPYREWTSFKISCQNNDEIRLIAMNDTLILVKDHGQSVEPACSINFINAHIYEQGIGLYGINYKVSYSKEDRLVYEQLGNEEGGLGIKTFQLKAGTFKEICKRIMRVNLATLAKQYPSKMSELEIIELEIGLEDGRIIKTRLENNDYPEELMLALIPVLYGHQRYVYKNLPPVK